MKNFYYPNKYERYFVFPILLVAIFFAAFAGYCISEQKWLNIAFAALISIISFWAFGLFQTKAKQLFIIDDGGLVCVENSRKRAAFISWQQIKFAYYRRTSKFGLYLILSTKELCKKEVKQSVFHAEIMGKILYDGRVSICLGLDEDAKRLFEERISRISDEWMDPWAD